VEKAWRNLQHIVRLDGLHLWLRIEEPHPWWRQALLVLLDDTVILAVIPLFLVFAAAGAPSPTRSLILLWAGYYLLMVVVVFHNEIRYRSTLLPFVLAGAAGGAAVLRDPERRRRPLARAALVLGTASSVALLVPHAAPLWRAARAWPEIRAARRLVAAGDVAAAERHAFAAASLDRQAARPWLAFGSALAKAGHADGALDAYRRAEERKPYVWTPRLVRPRLLADAGRPAAEALAAADAFSWQVDPWLAQEIAWRELAPPAADNAHPAFSNLFVQTEPLADLGGLLATRHLLSLGHRRIACIGGPDGIAPSEQRIAGWRTALADAGCGTGEGLLWHGNFTSQGGYEAMHAVLRAPEPPTAVFVCNDLMAMGALCAAHERDLRVPEALSIVGFDDIELTAFTSPPLTTVAQPKQRIGALAVDMLLERIDGKRQETRKVMLQPELRVRSSTAPVAPIAPAAGSGRQPA